MKDEFSRCFVCGTYFSSQLASKMVSWSSIKVDRWQQSLAPFSPLPIRFWSNPGTDIRN